MTPEAWQQVHKDQREEQPWRAAPLHLPPVQIIARALAVGAVVGLVSFFAISYAFGGLS